MTDFQTFTVGDRVRWISSGTYKAGVVTHVVPAGDRPTIKAGGGGAPRKHESYVVRGQHCGWTQDGTPMGPKANYWPIVSLLKLEAQS